MKKLVSPCPGILTKLSNTPEGFNGSIRCLHYICYGKRRRILTVEGSELVQLSVAVPVVSPVLTVPTALALVPDHQRPPDPEVDAVERPRRPLELAGAVPFRLALRVSHILLPFDPGLLVVWYATQMGIGRW